jgi:adenylate kinase family enzyme
MILVNLFGAPGAGKSTGAAYIFSQLKMRGINAELVTEFAKDKVREGSKAVFENQAYIFGKQYFRISRCADQVDVIVTDSPLLLSILYNNDEDLGGTFDAVVRKVAKKYNSKNYYLKRVKDYNPSGRFQTEEESDEIATELKRLLDREGVDYKVRRGDYIGYEQIVEDIMREFVTYENTTEE